MKKDLLLKVAAVMVSSLLSTSVLAELDQLDILGLVPGVSDSNQVRKIGKNFFSTEGQYFEIGGIFEIGGHETLCGVNFINGKLAMLTCWLVSKYTKVPSHIVYSDMKEGFTRKFGKPDFVMSDSAYGRAREILEWKDKQGNQLLLTPAAIDNNNKEIDSGWIIFQSSESLKQK
jgi:hypothetical protein